jgi:hypothetical protein
MPRTARGAATRRTQIGACRKGEAFPHSGAAEPRRSHPTFARDSNGVTYADIDLDEHKNLKHVFDVIKHKLTGNETHPYFIHEVLVFSQGCDPEYRL